MGKAEKLSSLPTYPNRRSKRPKTIEKVASRDSETNSRQHANENNPMELNETIVTSDEMSETDENWHTVVHQRSKKLQKVHTHTPTTTTNSLQQTSSKSTNVAGVHSYFSFGDNNTRKPNTGQKASQKSSSLHQQTSGSQSSAVTYGPRGKTQLPPFKLEFEAKQKPSEILVLNDLVKHNERLNVNTALYSTRPLSSHILLVFANDPSTYELLLENSSWPTSICGLTFKVTLPNRTPTSYSVLVNRVPGEWDVDTIKLLITERYASTIRVVRIYRDGQPINRVRVDFRSNEDVQLIHQCSHIAIGSVRYPAAPYKPLVRIDRCYQCQAFGHKAANW